MYYFKGDGVYNPQIEVANEIGIAPETLSRILNKKQSCSKTLAYAITKFLDPNCEIEDFFNRE